MRIIRLKLKSIKLKLPNLPREKNTNSQDENAIIKAKDAVIQALDQNGNGSILRISLYWLLKPWVYTLQEQTF